MNRALLLLAVAATLFQGVASAWIPLGFGREPVAAESVVVASPCHEEEGTAIDEGDVAAMPCCNSSDCVFMQGCQGAVVSMAIIGVGLATTLPEKTAHPRERLLRPIPHPALKPPIVS